MIGFSFEGNVIPAGEGLLTSLDIEVTDFEGCISDIVVSSPDGQGIDFEAGDCVALPCSDADSDQVCDNVDDCIGEYDDCGICNGGNADQDCNGDCFGDAFVDDCGICSEGNTDHDANSDQDCNGDLSLIHI